MARVPLPDALWDAATYPPGTGTPTVRETHASWIALAGPYAYKLKKPVRFPFLDYSTPERRRAACATELELNRRFAPSLYLDLQGLRATATGAAFGPDGADAEPAVRMRRFPPEAELDRRLAAGVAHPDELARLGTDLAGWHAQATVAERPVGGRTEQARTLAAAEDALAPLAAPGSRLAPGRVARLARALTAGHAALGGWFDARHAAGRVRECHGDLHAGNVVLLDGRLVPFDGIDFSAELRFVDVASDVAFLAMDLARHDRADLECALLSAWFAGSGDYDAAHGLPWYVAYRALVRAEVAALRARQQTGDAAERAWREADASVALAERRLAGRRGRLVATVGPSGSGKSRLAAALVSRLPGVRISSDLERKRLAGLAPLASSGAAPEAGPYTADASDRVYARLADAAGTVACAGYDAIVDSTALARHRREAFAERARRLSLPLAWLECSAPPEVLRARVLTRRGDPSEATVAILERQLTRAEPLSAEERAHAVGVDTSAAVDADAVAAALRAAAAPPGGSSAASAPES